MIIGRIRPKLAKVLFFSHPKSFARKIVEKNETSKFNELVTSGYNDLNISSIDSSGSIKMKIISMPSFELFECSFRKFTNQGDHEF